MGIPVGDLSPRGTGMGKKCSPQAFVGILAGKFFRRGDGDGDGELFPGGEFPVAIPSLNTRRLNIIPKYLNWTFWRDDRPWQQLKINLPNCIFSFFLFLFYI
jgi:hypothetical protein